MAERKVVLWLRKAALQDFAPVQYTLGIRLLSEISHKAALEWLLKAADQNYAAAQLGLGLFHIKENDAGVGAGAMDDTEAVKWVHKAALQRYDFGQHWYAGYLHHC